MTPKHTYRLQQSTDIDAFDDTPSQPANTEGLIVGTARGGPASSAQLREIRKNALQGVRSRAESTVGSGKLKGKVGVITGVGPESGIGTAAAKLFAREGAKHIYLGDYDDTALPNLKKWLESTYPPTKITILKADAASPPTISTLISQVIEENGHLDFFFANAGVSQIRPRPVSAIDEKEFEEVMRINALGVFVAIKYASEAMKIISPEKGKSVPGGSIILTASIAGLKANAGPIPYSASKAAVVSMAQTAAYDLSGYNIRVNALCPGLIETDMTRGMFTLAEAAGKSDKMGVLNPAHRQGLGSEVAQVALFLASDDSSYVNGQAIPIDGGLSSGVPYAKMKL
uniref:2,4-dienoyl-CoA reductase n=1 Tax=Kwoniella bestiolae CBS 10118 TaxID=1296100 RepID=A0A1B9FWD0_9TREE|nr:2,4-dienoyl-CoA reductase [Kwoniella bestiolae CBS 10118]OCF23076.1 2,4-dienoyl-CoA reductase [Kwoniella bestiolae CBS 10118]